MSPTVDPTRHHLPSLLVCLTCQGKREKKLPEDPSRSSPRLPRPYFIFFFPLFFFLLGINTPLHLSPSHHFRLFIYSYFFPCLVFRDARYIFKNSKFVNTVKMVEKLYVTYNDVSLKIDCHYPATPP